MKISEAENKTHRRGLIRSKEWLSNWETKKMKIKEAKNKAHWRGLITKRLSKERLNNEEWKIKY